MSSGDVADILIIGGGPTGLFGAYYAGLRQMSVTIVDSLDVLGGQLITLYPEKYIYDVAGFPKVLAKDLAANLVEQAMQYSPTLRLGEQVRTLTPRALSDGAAGYAIETSCGTHVARSVLIAAGVGAFTPRALPIPEAKSFEGRGLCYSVAHVEDFRDKRILIIGGGDSAVDWANTLAALTASQTLIHRRDAFRAHEDSVQQMRQGPTRILLWHELRSLEGDRHVERAIVYDNRSKAEQTIEVDAVLANLGFISSLGPIANWGLELEGNSIGVDSMMHTNRPGVFAAGDVAAYAGKLKLIATGFAEACTAVNFAKVHIDPSARAFPGHSSEMKR